MRTVASCTLWPCAWGVSSMSVSWAVLGGVWCLHLCQGLAKRGLDVDIGIPVCWMGCGMGDSSLTAVSPGLQTCLVSPLFPAELLTMRISLAPGPPVWRLFSPPDTSQHTGEVSPKGMDWACYGMSSGLQPSITTKFIWPSHTCPGFTSCPKDHATPQSRSCLGVSRAPSICLLPVQSQQHWGAGTGRPPPC